MSVSEWWDAGMVICLEQGADLHMAQLMPLSLASVKSTDFTFLCTGLCVCVSKLYVCVSYLLMYRTDLCQIFRIGRTADVDDQSEISFAIPQGMLPWQPVFVGFIHRTDLQ